MADDSKESWKQEEEEGDEVDETASFIYACLKIRSHIFAGLYHDERCHHLCN